MRCIIAVVFLSCMLLSSCVESREAKKIIASAPIDFSIDLPGLNTDKSLLTYDNATSIWSLDGKPYSGFMVSFYPDNILKEKTGVCDGRKQGESLKWFADGHLKQLANYHAGKLHGEKKMWSSDQSHILLSHLQYRSGKAHGKQLQWYPTGELYKKLHLNMGREEGIQQAFRKNGELYANYEAKQGRIFGLKKAALCYGLEDETLKDSD